MHIFSTGTRPAGVVGKLRALIPKSRQSCLTQLKSLSEKKPEAAWHWGRARPVSLGAMGAGLRPADGL